MVEGSHSEHQHQQVVVAWLFLTDRMNINVNQLKEVYVHWFTIHLFDQNV